MVKQYSDTYMGRIRREQGKETTSKLINEYHTFNSEGKKAARDELRERAKLGNSKAKVFLKSKEKPKKRRTSDPFSMGLKGWGKDFRF